MWTYQVNYSIVGFIVKPWLLVTCSIEDEVDLNAYSSYLASPLFTILQFYRPDCYLLQSVHRFWIRLFIIIHLKHHLLDYLVRACPAADGESFYLLLLAPQGLNSTNSGQLYH